MKNKGIFIKLHIGSYFSWEDQKNIKTSTNKE